MLACGMCWVRSLTPLCPRYDRFWHRHHRGALWAAVADHEPVQQTLRPGHHHTEHWFLLRGHQHPGPAQHQHHGKGAAGWHGAREPLGLGLGCSSRSLRSGQTRMPSSEGCSGVRKLLAVSFAPEHWRAVSYSQIMYPFTSSSSCSLATPVLPIIFAQIMSCHD